MGHVRLDFGYRLLLGERCWSFVKSNWLDVVTRSVVGALLREALVQRLRLRALASSTFRPIAPISQGWSCSCVLVSTADVLCSDSR